MILHRLGLVMIFCLCLGTLSAQCKLVLNGQVKDRHDGSFLEYASIYIPELKKDYTTDESGHFLVENICPGAYHFDVFHIGCESQSFYITIQMDTAVVFEMEHHLEILSEVLVTDHKHDRNLSQASYAISGAELQRLKSQSIASMVAGIPGVDMVQTGGNVAKPVIQGLSGNRIALVTDGVILESQQWGIDHAPEINGSQAEKISVIKSSAPILYGSSAMGGVILVDYFKAVQDPHPHGILNLSYNQNGRGLGSSAKLFGKIKNWTYNTQGLYKKSGDKQTPTYFLNNTGAQEWAGGITLGKTGNKDALRFSLDYVHQNLGILRGAHIGNTTDLENALLRDEPFFTEPTFSYGIEAPRQNVGHLTSAIHWDRTIATNQSLKWTYDFQMNNRQEFDVRRGGRSDRPIIDLRLMSHTARLVWELSQTKSNTKAGLDFRYQDNDNLPGTGALPLIPDYLSWKPSAFLLQAMDLSDHFHAEYGMRYEFTRFSVFPIVNNAIEAKNKSFHGGAANVGLVYFNENTSVKLDASFIARAPQVNEMYNSGLHQGIAALEFGNADLDVEKSIKFTADIGQSLAKAGKINLTLYGQRVSNFIYLAPSPEPRLTVRGAFLVYNYTNNDAFLTGFDLMHLVTITKNLEWTNKLAYIRAINTDENKELVLTPPYRMSSSLQYDVPLNVTGNKTLELFTSWKYTSRQNQVLEADDFLSAPEAYQLIDAGMVLHIPAFGLPLDLELSCTNLLNKTYRDYMNRLRYFADDLGRNLHLSIQLKF